ncbi:MAG: hypothetical protein LBJ02_11010 [Bifidobacteriaceae bacterium]|jgi:hypothetical protein|nr:hypothetical protein [Bifidobacteriaceae bacterium]
MPPALTSALAESHHLLVLAPDVSANEITILASTRWRAVKHDKDKITLSRYSSLTGPHKFDATLGAGLGLPSGFNQAWAISTLTERGDRPFPGSLDPTGVSRAFPDGLPIREERRVADFLISAARRLGGVVRFHGSGISVAPVPDSALDLTVYSPLWLEPQAALATARSLVPDFALDIAVPSPVPAGRGGWTHGDGIGGPTGPALRAILDGLDLSPERRAELRQRASEHDRAAMAEPPVLDRYALSANLGPAGTVIIEIAGTDEPPGALRQVPWAADGAVAYKMHWIPPDPKHLLMEFPPPDHCHARSLLANLVAALASLVHQTVGGEILDADDFPIDPADL